MENETNNTGESATKNIVGNLVLADVKNILRAKYRYDIRCDCCGRFIKYEELCRGGGGSSCFVPDSEYSYEETTFRCKKCTDKEGMINSRQMGINNRVCCAVA